MNEVIVVLTTGGTIGSLISNHVATLDTTGKLLSAEIAKIVRRQSVAVDVRHVFNKHSEDMKPDDWITIIRAIDELSRDGVRKIVITHGTDTLAYTAAAIGLFYQDTNMHICVTGSFRSIDDANSDAKLNLLAALGCVSSSDIPPGVYVAFKTPREMLGGLGDEVPSASIISAFDVKPMRFDDVGFSAIYGNKVASYFSNSNDRLVIDYRKNFPRVCPSLRDRPLPAGPRVDQAASQLLMMRAYPGLNLSTMSGLAGQIRVLILELYHSGTGPSDEADQAKSLSAQGIQTIMTGFPRVHMKTSYSYESTIQLAKAGIPIYEDVQPHVIYVLLALGLAQGRSVEEILATLAPWRFEFTSQERQLTLSS